MADKLVLVNPFDEITICSLCNALFIHCFKLIYTARVIDCKHRSRQASFPTGTVGPRVGIFLSPLNTNDGFYFSYPCYLKQDVK